MFLKNLLLDSKLIFYHLSLSLGLSGSKYKLFDVSVNHFCVWRILGPSCVGFGYFINSNFVACGLVNQHK